VSRVVWGRDALNRLQDRVATAYKVEVSADGRAWQTVATGEDRAAPGQDCGVSLSAAVGVLDPGRQEMRRELLEELRRLGVSRPGEVKSGPQVGEGVKGGFAALFLNGAPEHVGKQRCPV
jgi:hypothetical protein